MSSKVGLILGSTRQHSNTFGISEYLLSRINSSHPQMTIERIHLSQSSGHPLPLIIEDYIPASHPLSSLPEAYSDESIRKWSKTVLGWDGLIVLSPQYNWGYPAPLKNAFDHLFNEWNGLPVAIATLGGHGGSKAHEQLKVVLGGGCKMILVEKGLQVDLPRELIVSSEERVKGDEEWLRRYDEEVEEMIDGLVEAMEKKREKHIDAQTERA
ncbi:hypothetical protein CI109_104354 [Kwoniella shandongensis]|uniref:Uncharacterized protein n=1 Tax=Kwoniella shandongensis TaxID=1734106 RepID=A0A5M6BX64_9TREE|nr:uncharacterized protein CI109_004250 [Kwoniella shandongensis]KAA5527434.1 hypothetical protein CI109_004250 [Kwoniella shandongensis]